MVEIVKFRETDSFCFLDQDSTRFYEHDLRKLSTRFRVRLDFDVDFKSKIKLINFTKVSGVALVYAHSVLVFAV